LTANAQQYPNQQPGYPQQQQAYPQQQPGYDHDRDRDYATRWDAPPNEFNELSRRAFHDGIDAARFAAQNNRRMDFDDANNYRRPPVPRSMRNQYRASFIRGYQTAQQRIEWMRTHNDNDWRHDHDRWNNNYPYQPR
jgi:hypothetical protein